MKNLETAMHTLILGGDLYLNHLSKTVPRTSTKKASLVWYIILAFDFLLDAVSFFKSQ